ncbi:hypothetical protein AUR04nite_06380 [Glutamicibacter uratoxydans]|uniref:Lipoprotein n=1 Tax=Glutamicibacter uratoxydans TaxID=43667 RepID=A0A4Y4DJF0_GLUUR|nr:hypothetical protein [Glutamicibacter uratoxydans]GED05106.1 hypothetical protein AUR04nite_06380 [Glutamicibacter uratoxydans]
MALRSVISVLLALLLGSMLVSCSSPDALRVEDDATKALPVRPAPSTPSEQDYTQWEKPFGPAAVRKLLLDSDLSSLESQGSDPAEIREYLSTCAKCITPSPSYEVQGRRFQIYTLNTMGDGYSFASFVIADQDGAPQLALAVGGSDVYLSAGKEGSLVAQEAVYRSEDPMCCPSGWSVRLYRYQDGKFFPGEKFSSSYAPTPSEGSSQ